MTKTEAQRERHKRWLRKNPAFTIRQLEKWVVRAKDNPDELSRAKRILTSHKKRFDKATGLTDN